MSETADNEQASFFDGGSPDQPLGVSTWSTGIELKPASSICRETALARSAYQLLFHRGGEDLLLTLQEKVGRLMRAAFLRGLFST